MSKVHIFGGTGFVGTHLKQQLSQNHLVTCSGSEINIADQREVDVLLGKIQPDFVINLAAITTLKESVDDPVGTYRINFLGVLNILMSLKKNNFLGKFLFVSSSEVYGLLSDSDLPVSEDHPLRPQSPYAVAKIASEALCYQWSKLENFSIIVARPFNHIGPGQSPRFAVADFARQISSIKKGSQRPEIYVGDIDTTRDFTDVRDIVNAYELLLNFGKSGEIYNVCSGYEISIRELILKMGEMAKIKIKICSDPTRLRKSDQRRVRGDAKKLISATGWAKRFTIDETLMDILQS
jgi:GDP-4-dehydro-6-deoxy-D-mannose reductase